MGQSRQVEITIPSHFDNPFLTAFYHAEQNLTNSPPSREKHGHSRRNAVRPEYTAWKLMQQRCLNANHPEYAKYGGAGIRVCEHWQGPNGYVQFMEDVWYRPEYGFGLRRMDPSGHFEPGNVEWANTRPCRLLTYGGKTQPIKAWADELDVRADVLRARLHYGWSVEEVLGRPVDTRGPYLKRRMSRSDDEDGPSRPASEVDDVSAKAFAGEAESLPEQITPEAA